MVDEVLEVEARLIDSVTAGLGKIGRNTVKTANKMVRSFQKVDVSITSVGKKIFNLKNLLIGAGLVLAFNKTVGAASEFESQMREVATLSEEMADNIGKFSKEVLALSSQSGEGLDTLTKSLFDSISAGVEAGDAMEFLGVSTRLAIGGATETSIAVDGLTTILNGYGMEVEQATDVSDAFFTAMKFGKTTIAELAIGIGPLVPTAKAAGLAFDEMLGSVSALTKAGFSTPRAITAMQGALVSLNSLTPETKSKLDDLGLGYKITGEEGKTFIDVLNNISEAGGGTLEGVKKLVPNIEGVKGILALSSQEGKNFNEVMRLMGNRTGETAKAYAKMTDTFEFKSKRIKASFNTAFIEIGNQLMPLFDKIATVILSNMDRIKFSIAITGAVVKDVFHGLSTIVDSVIATFITFGLTIDNVGRAIIHGFTTTVNAIFGLINKLPGSIIPDSWTEGLDEFNNNQARKVDSNLAMIGESWKVVGDDAAKTGLATATVVADMDASIQKAATSMKDLTDKEKGLLGLDKEAGPNGGPTQEEKEKQAQDVSDFIAMQDENTLNMKKDANDKLLAEERVLAEEKIRIMKETSDKEKRQQLEDIAASKKNNATIAQGKRALTNAVISQGSRGLQALASNEKTAQKIAFTASLIQGSLAVQRALAVPPGFPFTLPNALAVGVMAAGNSAGIASQAFESGGFPQGRNANIRVNESGQEAVLNAGATSRLGVGAINNLNNGGSGGNNSVVNEVSYSPTYHIGEGNNTGLMDVLEQDKERFAEFFTDLQKRNYLDA